jgi:cAMP phosphodiesterase
MEIKVLGAHNLETRNTRLPCLIIDGLMALDAGGLTSGLTMTEQERIQAILLSHRHYDHARDIPILSLATFHNDVTLNVYALEDALEALRTHLLDGSMYPDFTRMPSPARPKLRLTPVEPGTEFHLLDYRVLPLAVRHGETPAVGYHLTSSSGKALFYTGDTSGQLAETWGSLHLDLVIIEVTFPDRMRESALETGHLTPSMLRYELDSLKEAQGAVPPIVVVHMHPSFEREIKSELQELSGDLQASITPAREGMVVRI